MRFTISGMYLAAVTIRDDDDPEGDWYTTIADEASERLPSGDHASGRILPRSSERPASRRDHWAVGRPLVRTCSPVIATFAASRRASSPRSPAPVHSHVQQPMAGGHHLEPTATRPVGLEHGVAAPRVAHQNGDPAPGQQSVGGVLRRIPGHVQPMKSR